MSNITQGDWIAKDGVVFHRDTMNTLAITVFRNENDQSEADYNAELMAAAPELLKAVQACYNFYLSDAEPTDAPFEQCMQALINAGFLNMTINTQSSETDWDNLPF